MSSTPPRNRTSSCRFEVCRADPPHSQAVSTVSGNRTPSRSFEDCDAIRHTHTACCSISTWNRTRTWTLGESCAVRYTIEIWGRRLDSHQHHPVYKNRRLSSSSHVGKARVQGVEPCPSVLEADCSPRSTLVWRVSDGNRTRTSCFTGRRAYRVHHRHQTRPHAEGEGVEPSRPLKLYRLPTGSRRCTARSRRIALPFLQ